MLISFGRLLILHMTVMLLVPTSLTFARTLSQEPNNPTHKIAKRSFHRLGCLGNFNPAYFSRLGRLCDDCYDLYRDVDVRDMCRSDCFTSDTFTKCAKALLIDFEDEKLGEMVNMLYGHD